MLVQDLVNEFKAKNIKNTQGNPDAVKNFILEKLEVKTYLPFNTKRKMVEIVVKNNIQEEDGIKKIDSINQYVGFVCAALAAYTNLEISDNPVNDYDELSKSGLLEYIVSIFAKDYSECDALLKMAVASELEDNNLNVVVNRFLNGILNKLDGVGDTIKNFTEGLDLSKLLGVNINDEEKTKILGIIDKLNK